MKCQDCGRAIHEATTRDGRVVWVHDQPDPFRWVHSARPEGAL